MELRGFGSSTVTRKNEKENEKEKKQIGRVERERRVWAGGSMVLIW